MVVVCYSPTNELYIIYNLSLLFFRIYLYLIINYYTTIYYNPLKLLEWAV